MKTVRTIARNDPESMRMMKVEGGDLTIRMCGEVHRFPECHSYSILENLDFMVSTLTDLKRELEVLDWEPDTGGESI